MCYFRVSCEVQLNDSMQNFTDHLVFKPGTFNSSALLKLLNISLFAFFIHVFQRFKQARTPSSDWGPALNENRIKAGYPVLAGEDDDPPSYGEEEKKEPTKKDYIPLETPPI